MNSGRNTRDRFPITFSPHLLAGTFHARTCLLWCSRYEHFLKDESPKYIAKGKSILQKEESDESRRQFSGLMDSNLIRHAPMDLDIKLVQNKHLQ
ncbi:hypothetical protein DYP60_13465 [Sphaerochaeta halotolerans]|uniref:Uncharacterized protein n=1 Tax=Sphaerochaeta halotolerans TaxID=2293840 RepID=A0A372MD56_9SPIR|nr:hypothetical protein DYP60_13465 [Sphaerochaeta halotolerans]